MHKSIKVSEFLHRVKEPVELQPEQEYSLVTIKVHHRGVTLRNKTKGKLIGSKMHRISKGQFILSGIDARHGAFGIVPDELDGAIVTNDFWYFDIDETKVKRDFFYWLTNTPIFLNACIKSSQGVTQRVRLQAKLFFDFEFRFPPLEEQENFLKKIQHADQYLSLLRVELNKQEKYVSQLKQAILQEAIAGQLTAEWRTEKPIQKGNPDTDAAALLAKIKAEKQRLIADGKLKKETKQESILETNLQIPDTWENPFLGDITNQITDGTHQTPSYVNSGKTFLSAQNVKPFRFIPANHRYITEQAFIDYRKNRIPEKGDLLIARVGAGIGETAVLDQDIEFAFYVSLSLVKVFKELTNSDYLTIVCNSPYGVQYAKGNVSSTGTSAGNYNLGRIRSLKIPLPPLAEQKVIVEKVDKLMNIIDQLEQQIKHRKQLAEDLMQTILREAFE